MPSSANPDVRPDMNAQMLDRIEKGEGFIAALDQSGGSTPKALAQYGVPSDAYSTEEEMFDRVHEMRTRIVTSPAFTGDRILGAILFEGTMDRHIEGEPSATYLWERKGVVPFLKVDQGLADRSDGVQMMKPMPDLDSLLARANEHGVFGTKMRSVIHSADPNGVEAIVAQQFEVADRIVDSGLVPILEPEVSIDSPEKEEAEGLLREHLGAGLDGLPTERQVMLKLSIPTVDGFYRDLIDHPRTVRVVALSGGYSRDEANERLARNPGLIASFSRALIGELSADQSDDEFDRSLDAAIGSIYAASVA